MIVGITGAARSGKDSVFKALAQRWAPVPTEQVQVSALLKAYLRELFDWTIEHTDGDLKDVPDKRYPIVGVHVWVREAKDGSWFQCVCGTRVHASEAVPPGKCVTYLTPRKAMQKLGGEFPEATYPPIYAVRAARLCREAEARGSHAVITDLRYVRDLKACKEAGGVIIEVIRPDAEGMVSEEAARHGSETARRSPEFRALVDHVILNEGTLDDLTRKVEALGLG